MTLGKPACHSHGEIEQSLNQNDFRTRPHFLPAIETAFASRKKLVWRRFADAAPVEIAVQRKYDAMGKSIEAFRRDHTGLLKISERVPKTHQPGAQASARSITDSQRLDQFRPMQPALIEVNHGFRMPV